MEVVVVGVGARVKIRVVMRSHAGATDYWDGNWLDCSIEAVAGGFRDDYVACLRVDELVSFREDLERLHRELRGVGRVKCMEDWIAIELSGDGRGHFRGPCRLRDRPGDGNTLEFEIAFDQTEIPRMVDELMQLEAAFPLVGERAG